MDGVGSVFGWREIVIGAEIEGPAEMELCVGRAEAENGVKGEGGTGELCTVCFDSI